MPKSPPDDYVRAQLLGLSVNDLFAREFFYHRSCQRNITRTQKNRGNEEYKTTKECFENLVTYVRNNLISRGEFSTMPKLRSYYKQLQTEKNIPVTGVAHKDVKRKLQLEFGGELLFYQESRTQSEFVHHKSVPIEKDERSWFFMNIEEKVTKTAEIIREEIVKSPSSFSR